MTRKNLLDSLIKGRELRKSEVIEIESGLQDNPIDVNRRTLLLGYYHSHQLCCSEAMELYLKHLLWLIEYWTFNDIFSSRLLDSTFLTDEAFTLVRSAWEGRLQKDPDNYLLIASYAGFMYMNAPRESERLYKSALRINPNHRGIQKLYAECRKSTIKNKPQHKIDLDITQIPMKRKDGTYCDGNTVPSF